jgi:hypothetical protein
MLSYKVLPGMTGTRDSWSMLDQSTNNLGNRNDENYGAGDRRPSK